MPADPTPADARALAEVLLVEDCQCERCILARALLAALDEREAMLADLPHALGRCGCEPIGSDYSSRLEMSVPTWPEAHTAAIARLEGGMT